MSNNPIREIDPNGRYEVDVHYHLIRVLAMAAGFKATAAAVIADADQRVDTHPLAEPFRDFEARSNFHFTSEARRLEVWESAIANRSLGGVGVYLRLQQDSFSHAGFGPGVGHLAAGHAPDKTYNDVPRANMMARDSYMRLTDAMYRIQRSGIFVHGGLQVVIWLFVANCRKALPPLAPVLAVCVLVTGCQSAGQAQLPVNQQPFAIVDAKSGAAIERALIVPKYSSSKGVSTGPGHGPGYVTPLSEFEAQEQNRRLQAVFGTSPIRGSDLTEPERQVFSAIRETEIDVRFSGTEQQMVRDFLLK